MFSLILIEHQKSKMGLSAPSCFNRLDATLEMSECKDSLGILCETVLPGGFILNALQGNINSRSKRSGLPDDVADAMSTAHTVAYDLVQEVALQTRQTHGCDFRINAEESTQRVQLFTGNSSSYCYHFDPLDVTLLYINDRDRFTMGVAISPNRRIRGLSNLLSGTGPYLFCTERSRSEG